MKQEIFVSLSEEGKTVSLLNTMCFILYNLAISKLQVLHS
ncbi:hypothetical protein SK137_0927 [Streptococcus mitis]|nr:hypothetical protein SK137_0927 [Streptococcus mitis]